ncbi:MAG: CBS domain-containing protein [Campylobacterales bacterium]|nr:CBS domain-containing protein [Campylobacterales bacterium]
MFAMYDDDGLNFRSTIDRLYSVHGIESSQAIKNKSQNPQEHPDFQDTLDQKSKVTQKAKDQYRQIANLDTKHEIFHVNEIMSSELIIAEDSMSIQECYDLMQEHNIQQLPIKSDTKMHLKGMITKHFILELLIDDPSYVAINLKKKVDDIIQKKLITTDPISDIRRVAKVMVDFNLNAIPVVNNQDEAIGIVTRNDIIKAIANIPHLQIWA